jgi:hypothetical protein
MPRLTVLMPARDAGASVERAVRSTLRDLPRDAELLVGDDGSKDRTLARLSRIDDRRLRVLSFPHRGIVGTLTALLAASDSAYVARMDADDVALPGRFDRQMRALANADAVFTGVATWAGRGLPRPPWPRGIGAASFPFHLLLSNPVAHSTLTARRDRIDQVGGYREVPSEDYDLWLRLATDGARLRRLAMPSILYRVHPAQVTATTEWRQASWRDELTRSAFAELSTILLGAPQDRITSLAVCALPRAAKLARFAEFERRFRRAISSLPPIEQRLLVRRLEQRAEWLWQRIMEPHLGVLAVQPSTKAAS